MGDGGLKLSPPCLVLSHETRKLEYYLKWRRPKPILSVKIIGWQSDNSIAERSDCMRGIGEKNRSSFYSYITVFDRALC